MIASAFDYRIVGVDKMALRTDAASELDLIEALFDLHVGGIAAPAPDALIGREGMFEPGACGERTDEDLEVDSWSLSLLAGEEDPSVAVRVAGSGVLPASGLGMNATRARNASWVRSVGLIVLSRTIHHSTPSEWQFWWQLGLEQGALGCVSVRSMIFS